MSTWPINCEIFLWIRVNPNVDPGWLSGGYPQIVISATQIPLGTTTKACQDDPTAKDAIQEITAALHGKWSNQCRCTNCQLMVNDGMTIIKFSIFRAIFLSPSDCWMTFVIPFTASGRRMAASKRVWKPCRKGWRLAEFNLLWRGFFVEFMMELTSWNWCAQQNTMFSGWPVLGVWNFWFLICLARIVWIFVDGFTEHFQTLLDTSPFCWFTELTLPCFGS